MAKKKSKSDIILDVIMRQMPSEYKHIRPPRYAVIGVRVEIDDLAEHHKSSDGPMEIAAIYPTGITFYRNNTDLKARAK